MIRLHILRCGSTRVDEALPFSNRSKNPLAFTGIGRGRRHRIDVPVTAYLIEANDRRVLVDTGWHTDIRTHPLKYEGVANAFASPGFLPEGEAVTERLARLGMRPRDLDACILTHLDIDHAGGLPLVKDAKRVLVSAAEWRAAQGYHPRYRRALWQGVDVETFPDAPFDPFGDGAITCLPLHGHSPGMTGVRVESPDRYAVIAGDAGYGAESWRDGVLPGIVWNRGEAARSLEALRTFANDPRCAAVLMTHDRDVAPGIIELQEGSS